MKVIRLILSLAFFVPAFARFGAFAAYDIHERSPWLGVSLGAVIGGFFGLVFGGVQGRWLDAILGEEERTIDQGRRTATSASCRSSPMIVGSCGCTRRTVESRQLSNAPSIAQN